MYEYRKKLNPKKWLIVFAVPMIAFAAFVGGQFLNEKEMDVEPVMKEEDEVMISLPDKEEVIALPFDVDAVVVKEYYDGQDHEVADFTGFEGVYRPNQGIDYAFNQESFEVMNMVEGEVSEAKEDAVFGNSVSITSGKLVITYQSLDAINVKVGDKVAAKTVLGKASTNAYNSELGNHLHLVVTHNGKLVDPKMVMLKKVSEWK